MIEERFGFTNETLEKALILRKNVYVFLDYLFRREITEETYDIIVDLLPKVSAYADVYGDKIMNDAIKSIKATLLSDKESAITVLAGIYAKHFYSVDRNSAVHPYESVFLSAEHIMMQESRDEVVKIYCEHKMALSKDFKEPEDHLSIELCFMATIYDKMIDAVGKDDIEIAGKFASSGHDFLSKHLGRWIGLLFAEMKQARCHEFYLSACLLAECLINDDLIFLKEFEEMTK